VRGLWLMSRPSSVELLPMPPTHEDADQEGDLKIVGPRYHVTTFTQQTWAEFLQLGSRMAAFRPSAAGRVGRFNQGDRLLCYIVDGVGFVGMLEVTESGHESKEMSAWSGDAFPIRIPVRVVIQLPKSAAIPITSLIASLPRIRSANERQSGAWGGFVRGAPKIWPAAEAEVVVAALIEAEKQVASR
jgi:hypothetical protein